MANPLRRRIPSTKQDDFGGTIRISRILWKNIAKTACVSISRDDTMATCRESYPPTRIRSLLVFLIFALSSRTNSFS